MARKLDLIFSKRFKYNIWKIHAHQESPLLVLEIRNQEEMQVSFTVINNEAKIISDNFTLEETWWVSVAQVVDDEIIFYTFDADNNPEVKDFISYDLSNKKATRLDREFSLSEYLNSSQQKQNNKLEIPFHYPVGTEYFNTVSGFIKRSIGDDSVRGIDYLEKDNQIFISYFKEHDQKLVNRLIVMNAEQEFLLDEILGEFDKGIADNTFFLFNNKLIFVKGVTEIFIYQL